jgi:hypothetical protein
MHFPKRSQTETKEGIDWPASLFYLTLERLKIREIMLLLIWQDCRRAKTSVMLTIVMRMLRSPNASL